MNIITILAVSAAAFISSLTAPNGDCIPDYSRVGYRWGDKPIPKVKVVKTLQAPQDGSDASVMIQKAIDGLTKPGAILLKAGTYNLEQSIDISRSGVVLRGEGDGTVLRATGTAQRTLITVGNRSQRQNGERKSLIADDYVPFGADVVRVKNPEVFEVGDLVVVFRPASEKWIHDIHMDRIEEEFNAYGVAVKQWEAGGFRMFFERIITAIDGDRLHLDNPLPMALDSRYGRGKVTTCSWDRVREVGIENLVIESEYDPSVKITRMARRAMRTYESDERHCMSGVSFRASEHCWVRGVKSRYLGMSLVIMGNGAKYITVEDCHTYHPVSIIEGSRRYAFMITANAQLCLIKECSCDDDRHCFVTNGLALGPNVFVNCTATGANDDVGPHMKWGLGTLYDCVKTDWTFRVQDRGASGHGHGMAGANIVLWNCEADKYVIQDPFASAHNYAIGCIGGRGKPNIKNRPDGVWVSEGRHVEPESLYYYQLGLRRKAKRNAVPKECYK